MCQLTSTTLAQVQSLSPAAFCSLKCTLSCKQSAHLWPASSGCNLSAQLKGRLSAGLRPFESITICQLNCTLSTWVQSVSQSVYNFQLLCTLSAPGGVFQLISHADCLLGYSLTAQLKFVSSAHFQVVNLTVSSHAVCQHRCNLSTRLSAQLQIVNSAVSSGAVVSSAALC